MCKKLATVVLGGLVLVAVLYGTKFGSYVRTVACQFKNEAAKQASPELQIARIEHEMPRLQKEIDKKRAEVAELKVSVEDLEKEIADLRKRVEDDRKQLGDAAAELEAGKSHVVYRGEKYLAAKVTPLLKQDLATARSREAELASKVTLLDDRKEAAATTELELVTMIQKKSELRKVRLAEKQSGTKFDDSLLADLEKSLASVERDVRVKQTDLELAKKYTPKAAPNTTEVASDPNEVARELRNYLLEKK
jgi:chromosome segregation ATPase